MSAWVCVHCPIITVCFEVVDRRRCTKCSPPRTSTITKTERRKENNEMTGGFKSVVTGPQSSTGTSALSGESSGRCRNPSRSWSGGCANCTVVRRASTTLDSGCPRCRSPADRSPEVLGPRSTWLTGWTAPCGRRRSATATGYRPRRRPTRGSAPGRRRSCRVPAAPPRPRGRRWNAAATNTSRCRARVRRRRPCRADERCTVDLHADAAPSTPPYTTTSPRRHQSTWSSTRLCQHIRHTWVSECVWFNVPLDT